VTENNQSSSLFLKHVTLRLRNIRERQTLKTAKEKVTQFFFVMHYLRPHLQYRKVMQHPEKASQRFISVAPQKQDNSHKVQNESLPFSQAHKPDFRGDGSHVRTTTMITY